MSDILRERILDLTDDTGQGHEISDPSQAGGLGTVVSSGSVARACYTIQPAEIDGDQAEGSIPSFSGVGGTTVAVNIGDKVPPAGTMVLYEGVGGRLVFRYG